MGLEAFLGNKFELNAPLSEAEQFRLISLLKGPVPEGYLDFMKHHNGGEGPIGDESYLALFGLDEVLERNENLKERYPIAEYTVFASDGGNTIFAFNKEEEIIEFDLIGLEPEEAIKHGNNFLDFLASLP